MSVKLIVGISKKISQPDFGSLGASCHLEVELDPTLVFNDVAGFQIRVKQAYTACRQAVEEELIRGQTNTSEQAVSPSSSTNGSDGSKGHRASQKQLEYARQLAGQIQGLGVRRLEALAGKMFSKPLADLSILEASGRIDMLKEIKAGRVELAKAVDGAGR